MRIRQNSSSRTAPISLLNYTILVILCSLTTCQELQCWQKFLLYGRIQLMELTIMPCDYNIMSLISARSFSNYFHCGTLQIASCPFISDQTEMKQKKWKPVLCNKNPNKIYIKFKTSNTLTKASWIFKGMSKPKSSFWDSNKTNKFCSQLLHHMLLMVFPLHRANLSFGQNTTS